MSGCTERETNITPTTARPGFAVGRSTSNRAKKLDHVFVYFDNDQAGFAAKNSLQRKAMILGVDRRRAA
jgi:DNA primase